MITIIFPLLYVNQIDREGKERRTKTFTQGDPSKFDF